MSNVQIRKLLLKIELHGVRHYIIICFSCLTFPYKARYKHDSHFLTICNGKEASDQRARFAKAK